MSVSIRTVALLSALSAVTCGATTTGNRTVSAQTVPSGPVEVNSSSRGQLPVGQELDVRLQSSLSSDTAAVEQRFQATTAADVRQNGRLLVPAGSTVRGVVSAVKKAGRIDRTGSLTLSFDQMVVKGRTYAIRGTATNVFESRGIRDEKGTAGVGAGAGVIIGGILGGVKGAILGAAIGAGGAIAATDGKDIRLPAGSIIRIRFDAPVSLR